MVHLWRGPEAEGEQQSLGRGSWSWWSRRKPSQCPEVKLASFCLTLSILCSSRWARVDGGCFADGFTFSCRRRRRRLRRQVGADQAQRLKTGPFHSQKVPLPARKYSSVDTPFNDKIYKKNLFLRASVNQVGSVALYFCMRQMRLWVFRSVTKPKLRWRVQTSLS